MHTYDICDVWMALKLSSKNFIFLSAMWVLCCFVMGLKAEVFWLNTFEGLIIILVQSIFIYFANRSYIIDMKSGYIEFPRSDVENTIIDIILLMPYWNLMRRIQVSCCDIENIYVDIKRKNIKYKNSNGKIVSKQQILYTINIVGIFGSANLQFSSRQKRDEVRNAIQQCVKKYNHHNIDKKVAEFD